MNKSFLIIFTYILLLLHLSSYLFTHLLFTRCEFKTKKLKKYLLLRSIILNAVMNTVIILVSMKLSFKNSALTDVLRNILASSFTYRYVEKLALSAFICVVLSMLLTVLICRIFSRIEPRVNAGARQTGLFVTVTAAMLIPLLAALFIGANSTNLLTITDVCRRYEVRVIDEVTQEDLPEDYSSITLYNAGALRCEAEKLYLSVERDDLKQAVIKKLSLAAGGEYTFTLPESDSLLIKKNGGFVIYLSDERGNILDEITVPALKEGEHYRKNGDEWCVVQSETAVDTETIVPEPVFSVEGGFYDDPFSLKLTAEEGLTVYYTLDCSEPDENSTAYKNPIYVYDKSDEPNTILSIKELAYNYLDEEQNDSPVPKCMVVRAVALDENGNSSAVVTNSYFIGEKVAQWKNCAVLSMVSSPEGLIGPDGIMITGEAYDAWYREFRENNPTADILKISYLDTIPLPNFGQQGRNWEREADIQLLYGGEKLYEQNAGIRVQGNSHRIFKLKRFSIYARKEYCGSAYFPVPVVNEVQQHSLLIKEGDSSAIVNRLCKGRDVLSLDLVPISLFLNGEFFYDGYLYEKFDEKNVAAKYGLTEDNIILVKNGEFDENNIEITDLRKKLEDYMSGYQDMSFEESYEAINSFIDIQSYVDYLCINGYMANMDFTEYAGNSLVYRTYLKENDGFGDTRWRWGLMDVDLLWSEETTGVGVKTPWMIDTFNRQSRLTMPISQYQLYSALKPNPIFRRQFVLTFVDMMNTCFRPDNATAVMSELGIGYHLYYDFINNRGQSFFSWD